MALSVGLKKAEENKIAAQLHQEQKEISEAQTEEARAQQKMKLEAEQQALKDFQERADQSPQTVSSQSKKEKALEEAERKNQVVLKESDIADAQRKADLAQRGAQKTPAEVAATAAGSAAALWNSGVHLGMQVLVSIVLLIATLFVILSKKYDARNKHWAYATVGLLVGFWLKQ